MAIFKQCTLFSFIALFFASSVQAQEIFGVNVADFSRTVTEQRTPSTEHVESQYVADEVLVKFKDDEVNLIKNKGSIKRKALDIISGVDEKKTLSQSNAIVYTIKNKKSVSEMVEKLQNNAAVEYAQPNYIYPVMDITTNDDAFDMQWAMQNTGQEVRGVFKGAAGADIDVMPAWNIADGTDNDVVVAVIDSGVSYNHPDLAENMWDGSMCVSPDNQAIAGGCVHGYDTFDNDVDPAPDSSAHGSEHGTHVAGIIAAADNSIGILGVNPHAKIMAVKSAGLAPGATEIGATTASLIAAINFARNNGADIINMSLGTPNYDVAIYDAINAFPGLAVAAAGNGGLDQIGDDNDTTPEYPASFDSDHIIAVAATNANDALAEFSNYGATTVDIAAPGVDIYSTASFKEIFREDVQTANAPALPAGKGFGSDGYFGTYAENGNEKVFVGDTNQLPYTNDHASHLFSPHIDLSAYSDVPVFMDFTIFCDTEYGTEDPTDYMALGLSGNGTSFTLAEADSDGDGEGDTSIIFDENVVGQLAGHFEENVAGGYWKRVQSRFPIPDAYKTNTFMFQFAWAANAVNNNHAGCYVDDIVIRAAAKEDGDAYLFEDGTSMAAPHVSGLAALLLSFDPTLTPIELKNIIMNTGDALPTLDQKVVSGARINAVRAVESVQSSVGHLTVTGSQAQEAGQAQEVTITAVNADGTPLTSYTGDHAITFSGATSAPDGTAPTCNGTHFGTATTLTFTNGAATCDMILYKREGASIDVTDGTYNSTGAEDRDLDVTVSAASVSANDTALSVSPDPVYTGGEVTITVTAKDQYRNALAGGGDTVSIAVGESSDAMTPIDGVTDNGDGVYTVTHTITEENDVIVNGEIGGTAIGSDNDGIDDGVYHIEVRAAAEENHEESTEIEIEKPSMKLSSKVKRALSKKKKVYIPKDKITFKGEAPGLEGGTVRIKGKYGSTSKKETVHIAHDGTWSKKMKFKKDGTWKVKFTFYDKDGMEVDSFGTYSVRIDTEDPEFVDLPYHLNKVRGGQVWFDAKDSKKFKKFKVHFNGATYSIVPQGDRSKDRVVRGVFDIPHDIQPGHYEMVVKAYDKAGNSTKRHVQINVR